jgi:hypothetical protein
MAVAASAGVVFKQGMSSLGPSEFVGKVAKQFAVAAPTVKSQNAAVISVRAAGYDEELVKTAVLRFFISFNNLSLHLCYYIVAVISVRAAGYDEELVETAVHDFIFLLLSLFICVITFFFLSIVKNCAHRWTVRAFSQRQRQTGREFCGLFALSICNDCVSGFVVL